MPEASSAVTENVNVCPAVALGGAVTLRSLTDDAAPTVRLAVAERAFAASDAVSVCGPVWINLAENVPWPPVRVVSGGSTTPDELSLVLKCRVPA